MSPRRTVLLTAIFSLFLTVISGCTNNSTITHDYIDPTVHDMDLNGVLIVAVAKKSASRVEFEDSFARRLEHHGVRAVASHTLVPAMDAKGEDLLAAAAQANLDTVLVTRYIGEKAEEVYHPGTIYYDVMPAYDPHYRGGYGRFGGYYGHAYEVAYQQPVWTTNKTYTLISDLFTTENKEHLWQAVSDTVRSGSDGKLRDDVIDSFIKNMNDQGLLN